MRRAPLLLSWIAFAGCARPAVQIAFEVAPRFTVGDAPVGIAAADFDHDGAIDLAVIDDGDAVVGVLLNHGDGTFAKATSYPTVDAPVSVAAADFDSDGWIDLVVADRHGIDLLLNKGDGSFRGAVGYPTPDPDGRWLFAGDIDGNGTADVLTDVGVGSLDACALLGSGDGTLGSPRRYTIGAGAAPPITAADLDGDMIVDLAWLAFDFDNNGLALMTARGGGDGSFGPELFALALPGGNPVPGRFAARAADLDRDGTIDLVFVIEDGFDGPSAVAVALGDGDGTYRFDGLLASPQTAIGALDLADFDGDGKIDLVLGRSDGNPGPRSGRAALFGIMKGNGHGGFGDPDYYRAGIGDGSAFAVADLDGDRQLDLAVVDTAERSVSVLFAAGAGSLRAPRVAPWTGFATSGVAIGDFNGDGRPDLATATETNLAMSLARGARSYGPAQPFVTATSLAPVIAADLDHDGRADLVAVANEGIALYFSTGAASFEPSTVIIPSDDGLTLASLVAADVDGDGRVDVIALDLPPVGPRRIWVARNYGDRQFGAMPMSGTFETGVSLAAADFNGDGKADLTTGAEIAISNGDGSFANSDLFRTPTDPGTVAAGDFNQDNKADLLATDRDLLIVSLGDGAGHFASTTFVVDGARSVAIGDLDGDGRPDAAVGVLSMVARFGSIEVFLGSGGGALAPAAATIGAGNYRTLAIADLDRDGKPDIAADGGFGIEVFFNNSR